MSIERTATRDATTVVIHRDDLPGLASLVAEPWSPISPMSEVEVEPLNTEQRARLRSQGVVAQSGQIAHEYAPAFALLARASTSGRLRLLDSKMFEYLVYFDAEGDSVSLTNATNGLRIDAPAQTDVALEYLGEMIGASVLLGTQFEVELKPVEATVYAALVDDCRRRVLRALADGLAEPERPHPQSVERELARRGGGFIGIAPAVRHVAGGVTAAADGEVAEALVSLSSAGHACQRGDAFDLGTKGALLAQRFMHIERMLTLGAGSTIGSATPAWVELTCLHAGLHDLLAIESGEDFIRMVTLTTSTALALARLYLTQPEAIVATGQVDQAAPVATEPGPAAGAPQVGAGVSFCRSCGAPLRPQGNFCETCGARAQATNAPGPTSAL